MWVKIFTEHGVFCFFKEFLFLLAYFGYVLVFDLSIVRIYSKVHGKIELESGFVLD